MLALLAFYSMSFFLLLVFLYFLFVQNKFKSYFVFAF